MSADTDLTRRIKAILGETLEACSERECSTWIEGQEHAIPRLASLIAEEREKARLAGYAECGGHTVALIDAARASARREALEEAADLIANNDEMHEVKGGRRYLVPRVHQDEAPNLVNSAFAAAIRSLAAPEADNDQ